MNGDTNRGSGTGSYLNRSPDAPTQCAHRGRAEDAAAGTLQLIQMLQNMDEDVLQRMVQARETATNIHKAFPGGDQRFVNQDEVDDEYDDEEDNEEDDLYEANAVAGGNVASEDEEDDGDVCMGLFDDIVDPGPYASLRRVRDTYNFDLVSEMDNAKFDLFERIRVVNWIRKLMRVDCCTPENAITRIREIFNRSGDDACILSDDSFLTPVVPGDLLLTVLEKYDDKAGMTGSGRQSNANDLKNDGDDDDEDNVRIAVLQTLRDANVQ